MKVHKAEAIRRKDTGDIPKTDQTEAREEVADMIENQILARDDWITLEGRVADANGQPVASATVRATRRVTLTR